MTKLTDYYLMIRLLKITLFSVLVITLLSLTEGCKHSPLLDEGDLNPIDTSQVTNNCNSDTAYFENDVLPILISNCAKSGCHDAASHQDGVTLTDYNSIINTGDIRPGRPGNSKVFEMITETDPDKRMPPPGNTPLSQAEIDIIQKWIVQGALKNGCQNTTCDSTKFSFKDNIQPIFTKSCLGCHSGSSPQGNIVLSNYAGVSAVASDGRLVGAVSHSPGYPQMPQGGAKLDACSITLIRKWVDAGYPNN